MVPRDNDLRQIVSAVHVSVRRLLWSSFSCPLNWSKGSDWNLWGQKLRNLFTKQTKLRIWCFLKTVFVGIHASYYSTYRKHFKASAIIQMEAFLIFQFPRRRHSLHHGHIRHWLVESQVIKFTNSKKSLTRLIEPALSACKACWCFSEFKCLMVVTYLRINFYLLLCKLLPTLFKLLLFSSGPYSLLCFHGTSTFKDVVITSEPYKDAFNQHILTTLSL
jgi:hypothetical protein